MKSFVFNFNFMIKNNLNLLSYLYSWSTTTKYVKIINFSTNTYFLNYTKKDDLQHKKGVEPKKKKQTSPKIRLIDSLSGKSTSLYLEQAEKLAKRQNLKLEQLGQINNKSLFQLTEAHRKDINKKEKKNSAKKIIFSSKISQHDIETKISSILKFLQKGKEVKIIIEGKADHPDQMESTHNIVKSKLEGDFQFKGLSKSKTMISFEIKPSLNINNESIVEKPTEDVVT